MLKKSLLAAVLLLTACTNDYNLTPPKRPKDPPPPSPALTQVDFQFGQSVTLEMLNEDLPMEYQFLRWVNEGVYTNTPVYRQLPGIFVLTGKPRLKGEPFVQGTVAQPPKKQGKTRKDAGRGYVGLVIHADGTLGPELVLTYGYCVRAYCEGPANIRIAKIVEGREHLESVARGDNLMSVRITRNPGALPPKR